MRLHRNERKKNSTSNLTVDLASLAVEIIHCFTVLCKKRGGEALLGNVTFTGDGTIHCNLTARPLQPEYVHNSVQNTVSSVTSQVKDQYMTSSQRHNWPGVLTAGPPATTSYP